MIDILSKNIALSFTTHFLSKQTFPTIILITSLSIYFTLDHKSSCMHRDMENLILSTKHKGLTTNVVISIAKSHSHYKIVYSNRATKVIAQQRKQYCDTGVACAFGKKSRIVLSILSVQLMHVMPRTRN